MADQITRKIISLKWWSLIILVGNILLGQVVDGAPVAQQFLNLLTQMPSMIQYPGLYPLTGGQTKSLVNSNFGPNEIVTGSGMPSNFFASGPSAAIDFVSKMFSTAGEALGAAASSILSGECTSFFSKIV